jgi:hypothetical protein
MKKVLIISYYFPPCNLTPSERIYSWAKYLNECGIYPIVVTRNWDIPIKGFSDELKSSGSEVKFERNEGYEVWYLPYKQSFKESLFTEGGLSVKKIVYLILSFWTNFIQVFTYKYSPQYILYKKAEELLKLDTEKSIQQLLVSAYPYALFKFAFDLHNRFGIEWIADYRDDWTSNEILNKSLIHRFFNYLNSFNEKKWLSTAKCFTTVSNFYVQKIQRVIGDVKGYTIQNGFMPENYIHLNSDVPSEKFTISYVGSLYFTQPIEIFLNGVKRFIDENTPNNFEVVFIGIKNNVEAFERVKKEISGYENYFRFTERISKMEAIEIQHHSNLLLICTHTNMKGTPGSKLYEYIALKKLVLVTPGDNDIVEETLTLTNQALIARNEKEVTTKITETYLSFLNQDHKGQQVNLNEIEKFDRLFQTQQLAKIVKNEI